MKMPHIIIAMFLKNKVESFWIRASTVKPEITTTRLLLGPNSTF